MRRAPSTQPRRISPLIFTKTSSKCQRRRVRALIRSTRFLRISAANIGPNRFHHSRTASLLMPISRAREEFQHSSATAGISP